ncbi:MAG: hypothetical protein ACK5E6_04480 [Cyanobacteriota bacterium]|jgi:hypothetical protein
MRLPLPRLLTRLPLITAMVLSPVAARADVQFENCAPTGDGGFSCDTRPTGNTLMDDEAARFGLFNAASPGWNEFAPYQDLDDEMGNTGF